MRIALTGGIACGKSLVAKMLRDRGVETLDADDVVHELVPEDERRRIAKKVFADPAARKELEARLHPIVAARLDEFARGSGLRVEIIPLLFEVHWERKYDIICCVAAKREVQIDRMVTMRGYAREDAEARLAAQLPVAEKAKNSHYVINNAGSVEDLAIQVEGMLKWLKKLTCSPIPKNQA